MHMLSQPCSNFSYTCAYFLQQQSQSQGRYFEADNRDWRGRSGQLPGSTEEGSWEANKDLSGQSELRFQDSNNRNQVSGNQGVIISNKLSLPILISYQCNYYYFFHPRSRRGSICYYVYPFL